MTYSNSKAKVEFAEWKDSFRNQQFGIILINGKKTRERITATLDSIVDIDIEIDFTTSAALEYNVLLACYKAWFSPPPQIDKLSRERKKWELGFRAIPEQEESALRILQFISQHRNFAVNASNFGSNPNQYSHKQISHFIDQVENIDLLEKLLHDYARGLNEISDADHRSNLDITLDSQYGPFIFPELFKGERKRLKPQIHIIGLIFNLVYIFRFFTGYRELKTSSSFLRGQTLVINGEMIDDIGKPHYGKVAALVNATLGTDYSGRAVKEKLKDFLTRPSPCPPVRAKLNNTTQSRKREIIWADWPTE